MIKRILLSAVGGMPSISYIKHLQSNGYFVIGIDSNKSSIGFNFAMSFILYPGNNQHIKPSKTFLCKNNINARTRLIFPKSKHHLKNNLPLQIGVGKY